MLAYDLEDMITVSSHGQQFSPSAAIHYMVVGTDLGIMGFLPSLNFYLVVEGITLYERCAYVSNSIEFPQFLKLHCFIMS